eukprot:g17343.t1
MDLQRRGVQACRQPQPSFPVIAPPVGVSQRKKKWRPHCQHPTCLRPASYAGSSDSDPVFCEKHKTSGQQNVVHPNRGECESDGCGRVSAYASTEDTRARFCHLHKEDGMVKVRDNVGTRCEEETCIKQASFAMEGDRYPKFCKDHRKEEMINIRNHRCISAGCSRGASFAVSGSRGQFCSEHKAAGMVNTRRRNRCIAPGCTSREPIYVIEGQHIPKFCANHGGPGMHLPYPTLTPREDHTLQGCDRALELVAPGEAPQRHSAAHNMESQQHQEAKEPQHQQRVQEPPARDPRIIDEAASPDSPFATSNGSSRADATKNLADGRDHAETGQQTLLAPVKREITMTTAMHGSPGAEGGVIPPRQLEQITESPGHLGGIVTLDFNRHRVPPCSPEADRANGGPSASAPYPTAAWHMAAAGGRGGSSGSSEVDGREKQAATATAAQATAPPPPHVYQSLRVVGGGSGGQVAEAAATVSGARMARSSNPSTTAGGGGGVLSGGSERNSGAIVMAMEGDGKCHNRASRGFASELPAYAYTTTSSSSPGMSGAHPGFRPPSEFSMEGRRPLGRYPTDTAARGAAQSVGWRHEHHNFSQEQEQEQEQERDQQRRRPVVRLLHMDDPNGADRLPSSSDSATSPPASPAGPVAAAGAGAAAAAAAARQSPVTKTPTPTLATVGVVKEEIGTNSGEPREHGGIKRGDTTVGADREREENEDEEGGDEIAINLRPPHVGGVGGIMERGSATDSTVDATTTTEDEEGDEDLEHDRVDETSAPAVSTVDHKVVAGKSERRRAAKPASVAGTLKDTQPPGYTPTPFYFTLVKALTSSGSGSCSGTGKGSVTCKRKRLDE